MISDERFRKNEHILKSADFRRVYKNGISYKKGPVIFYCLANSKPHNRIGFSISSKNVKKAASRNRIRRCFREAYRSTKADLKNGFDIVIVVKSDIAASISHITAKTTFLAISKNSGILS